MIDPKVNVKMTYEGYTQEKNNVDISVYPVVEFQTTLVTGNLLDSNSDPLDTGTVKYYASGWKTFGTTSSGQVTKELLPGTYHFKMTYEGYTQQKSNIDINTDPVIEFQTKLVTVKLIDSNSDPLDTGTVKYYASGWKTFGTTSSGQVTKELLPGTYHFKMTYAGASEQKNSINIETTPTITYQTGKVHSNSGDVVKYYASGWQTFTNDMELLPGSYNFKYIDSTVKNFTIEAGKTNYID